MLELFPSREVVLTVAGFSIYWYGVLYAIGFALGLSIAQRLERFTPMKLSKQQWSSVLNYLFFGVVLGARLGYVLFYAFGEWMQGPLLILRIWEGGMSSHGGFIGVTIAVLLLKYRHNISLLSLLDTIMVPVAIGLALGRLGNFINQELYGTITTVPWAMHFDGVEGLRHPTQLYAIAKDLTLAFVCFVCVRRFGLRLPGMTTAVFLLVYSILRFIVEHFRVPTHSSFTIAGTLVTRGQLYSIPLAITGACLLYWVYTHREQNVAR